MRPAFEWTEEVNDEILVRISRGESIVKICNSDRDDWMPGQSCFYKRLSEDKDFAERYARAREVQAHNEFDEIREIADEATPEDVNVARLRIDARKWRASKLAPKKYGDRVEVENNHNVSDPLAKLFTEIAAGGKRIGVD